MAAWLACGVITKITVELWFRTPRRLIARTVRSETSAITLWLFCCCTEDNAELLNTIAFSVFSVMCILDSNMALEPKTPLDSKGASKAQQRALPPREGEGLGLQHGGTHCSRGGAREGSRSEAGTVREAGRAARCKGCAG